VTTRVSLPGVVAFVMAVTWSFNADPADARPERAPMASARPRAAWPRQAAQAESAFIADINGLRASQGLPVLQMRTNLTAKARRWATTMAADARIWHSGLSSGITGGWHKLGENVGRGFSQPRLHAAFVASDTHLANIVDPGFRYVGVGVVVADGLMFVSEVFMQPPSTASRRPLRVRSRTAKEATPVRPLHQREHPLPLPVARPGLLFRPMN
jgi:uncharacterized protein YkwD